MSRFVFISERTFEPWNWRNPFTVGIGGSETSHIEMAQGLARLGHSVISFAPTDKSETDPTGVRWAPVELLPEFIEMCADNLSDTVFVIYRAPRFVDMLPAGSIAWLICQDVDYTYPGNELTRERAAKFTRIVGLCGAHVDYLRRRLPASSGKIVQSSNGIHADLIREIAEDPPKRNPHRMIYASSPDRGLEYLLPIFARVREIVPDAELHVCYGFDNIEKVIARHGANSPVAEKRRALLAAMEQPGIVHYGRLNQPQLLREWFKSAVWCHPSNFTETSCITCMDAQACGAIPVTRPIWAIAENVQHGVFVDGDVRGEMVQARYARLVAELLLDSGHAESIRLPMMEWARARFSWSGVVRDWDAWAVGDIARSGAGGLLRPSSDAPEPSPAGVCA